MSKLTILRRKSLFFLLASFLLLAAGGTLQAKPTLQDGRFFPETGYGVENDIIWDYFQSRGGVDTFGYPVSELFDRRGLPVQIFQRHVLQITGQQARPLNLLDPDVMPINTFGGLTFPEYNQILAASAPAPNAANYGEAVREHLEASVPEMWQDHSLGFLSYYLSAAPADAGGLRTLLALEVWGFPTSQPKADPNNENFIYQRFQRGIMHYDATNNVTRGILLGDAFKEMITTPPPPSQIGSITGQVWHDICAISGGHGGEPAVPSANCVPTDNGWYRANGIFEPNEPGIDGIEVSLAEGACVSGNESYDALSTTITAGNGAFFFGRLQPGTYCLFIEMTDNNILILVPGEWTYPVIDNQEQLIYQTITIAPSEGKFNVRFGWDHQFLPVEVLN